MTKDEQIAKLKEKNKNQRIVISNEKSKNRMHQIQINTLNIKKDALINEVNHYKKKCKDELEYSSELLLKNNSLEDTINELESGIIGLVKKLK